MADEKLPAADPQAFDRFLRAQGEALRQNDAAPPGLKEWEERRTALRKSMFAAMGQFPEKPCELEAREVGVLKRPGYRIEKIVYQTWPDVWVSASAYVPEQSKGKSPAVLVVHGHWPWARRDPVVQARCLGLVKLGFFVLAVDAFGAGERFTTPGKGTYHGSLYGSTLWPAGQTLLGMQVYDNRRAVDYLLSRPEVDGKKLGITGASGGGNQTTYAGALDERFAAAVPVCSVGRYQAYLKAACCVCEVLPTALRFTEEGDVLGLTSPRALMVVNATRDAFQFSVGEAEKSLARAGAIFKIHGAEEKLKHAVFESPHDYSKAMRETMYGWMTRWLKEEGKGEPIPEPEHEIEKPEDLACFTGDTKPRAFLFPPSFAARQARRLLARFQERKPDHIDDWNSTAVHMRTRLRKEIFGDFPRAPKPQATIGEATTADGIRTTPIALEPEPGLPLLVDLKFVAARGKLPVCILLHGDGKSEALKHPLAAALLENHWEVVAPELRGTGAMRPAADAVGPAVDHNSAEHALWIGRPLLGQWVCDIFCLLDWLALQPGLDRTRLAIAGIGSAGVVAACAAALDERLASLAMIDAPATYVTEEAYGPVMRMGLLAPGILTVGDVAHLLALAAPRKITIAGPVSPQGKKLDSDAIKKTFEFTSHVYGLHDEKAKMRLMSEAKPEEVVAGL